MPVVTQDAGRPRRQLLVPAGHRGHPAHADDAGQGDRPGAGDDGLRLRSAARPARRRGRRRRDRRWQEQVLAKGWGYAIIVPTSVQADNGAGLTRGIIGLGNKGQPRKLGRLGRAAGVGLGRQPRARLLRDRQGGRREAGRDRGPVAVRQGRHRRDGLRRAVRHRVHRVVRRRRRQAPSAQLRRAGGERRRLGRVPLDGGQLHQVRRPADVQRPAGRLATSWSRCARRVPCSSASARWRSKAAGWTPRGCSWPASAPARSTGCWAGRTWGPRSSPRGDRADRRRRRLPPAQRRPHDRTELADVPDLREPLHQGPPRLSCASRIVLPGPRRLARRVEDLGYDQVVLERRQARRRRRAAHDRREVRQLVALGLGVRGAGVCGAARSVSAGARAARCRRSQSRSRLRRRPRGPCGRTASSTTPG